MGLVHGLEGGVPHPHCWVHIALHLPSAIGFAISLRRVLTLTFNSGVHWGPRFHGNQQFFKKPLENMSPRLSRGFRAFQKTENGAKSLKI